MLAAPIGAYHRVGLGVTVFDDVANAQSRSGHIAATAAGINTTERLIFGFSMSKRGRPRLLADPELNPVRQGWGVPRGRPGTYPA